MPWKKDTKHASLKFKSSDQYKALILGGIKRIK